MTDNLLTIRQAALYLGVTPSTLRRWEKGGLVKPTHRTAGNQRRYVLSQLSDPFVRGVVAQEAKAPKKTLCYARVSTAQQKDDLARQEEKLRSFCAAKGWCVEVLSDVGSGLNYKKRGLQHLLDLLMQGKIERLVITHKDRLLRFGAELIFGVCARMGIEVVVMDTTDKPSFEKELVTDMLELITVFSARLYGARSHKGQRAVAAIREAFQP